MIDIKNVELKSSYDRVIVKRKVEFLVEGKVVTVYICNDKVSSVYIDGFNLGTSVKKIFGISRKEFFSWLDGEVETLNNRIYGEEMEL